MENFANENFILKNRSPDISSVANARPNLNGSQLSSAQLKLIVWMASMGSGQERDGVNIVEAKETLGTGMA